MTLGQTLPVRASGCLHGERRVSASAVVPSDSATNAPFYFAIRCETPSDRRASKGAGVRVAGVASPCREAPRGVLPGFAGMRGWLGLGPAGTARPQRTHHVPGGTASRTGALGASGAGGGTSEPDGVAGRRRARTGDFPMTPTAVCLLGLLGSSGNLALYLTLPLSAGRAIQGQFRTALSLDARVRGTDSPP